MPPAPKDSSADSTPKKPSASVLLNRARASQGEDAPLFELFAALARESGRDDLAEEFHRRSQGLPSSVVEPARPAPPTPSSKLLPTSSIPEAVRRHDVACGLVRTGQHEEALSAFREAIAFDPRYTDAHCNLGVALARLKRLPEAEASFRLAIRLDAVNGTAYLNLATCLLQQSNPSESERWARQAIQLRPAVAEAHRILGGALDQMKKYEQAEVALAEAVRLDPKHAEAQHRYGNVLSRRDKKKEAEVALRAAVELDPKLTGARTALANVLSDLDKHGEAVDVLRETLAREPKSADLHNSLGVALAGGEQFAEAEASYREALRINPGLSSAHSNLGNTLRALGRLDEAEASLREALRRRPNYPEAHNNLGIVHIQKGEDEAALKCYDEALRLAPKYPEAHLNKALALLGQGDFDRGWPEYEWRWKVRPSRHKFPDGPRWDGSPMNGRPVLITVEQGLGDSIHFLRYAALVKARNAKVVIDCPPALEKLAATCPGIDQVAVRGKGPVTYDAHIPLLSLPGIFGVPPAAATAAVPYFRADPERVAFWRKELPKGSGMRIGIAWQGSKVHKGDRLRSVSLARFRSLQVPGVTLVSLQKGAGSEQLTDGTGEGMEIVDIGTKTDADMMDTAAVMMNLDLVVAVDTAVVHLAGALGRTVWVAMPYAADWRWLRQRDDSQWYPTMRLFRQERPGEWDGVFERMTEAVRRRVAESPNVERPDVTSLLGKSPEL